MAKKVMHMTYLGHGDNGRPYYEAENGCILCDLYGFYQLTKGEKHTLQICDDHDKTWHEAVPYCPVDPSIEFVATPKNVQLGSSGISFGVDEKCQFYVARSENLYAHICDTLEAAEQMAREFYSRWSQAESKKLKEFNHQIAMD